MDRLDWVDTRMMLQEFLIQEQHSHSVEHASELDTNCLYCRNLNYALTQDLFTREPDKSLRTIER